MMYTAEQYAELALMLAEAHKTIKTLQASNTRLFEQLTTLQKARIQDDELMPWDDTPAQHP